MNPLLTEHLVQTQSCHQLEHRQIEMSLHGANQRRDDPQDWVAMGGEMSLAFCMQQPPPTQVKAQREKIGSAESSDEIRPVPEVALSLLEL